MGWKVQGAWLSMAPCLLHLLKDSTRFLKLSLTHLLALLNKLWITRAFEEVGLCLVEFSEKVSLSSLQCRDQNLHARYPCELQPPPFGGRERTPVGGRGNHAKAH